MHIPYLIGRQNKKKVTVLETQFIYFNSSNQGKKKLLLVKTKIIQFQKIYGPKSVSKFKTMRVISDHVANHL